MIKSFFLSILFILVYQIAFAQKQQLILTAEQNGKWLDSLKTLPIGQQLLMIKDRLLLDTNVFVRQSLGDRITVTDSLGNRVQGDGKPTLIIGGYKMFIDNKTHVDKVVSLSRLLTTAYIKSIIILSPNDPAATAIYGSASQFGFIVMTIKRKKDVKRFKELELKPNY